MALSTLELGTSQKYIADLPAADEAMAPAGPPHRRQAVIGWAVLGAACVIGFHQTFVSIGRQSYNGDPLAYLFLLPLWGAIVAVGTRLRRGPELEIHDRQIDWILALGPLAVALIMIIVLVSPRLGVTTGLVRIDVFALLVFALFGSVLIFGARTTGRYWASWVLLLACWPLLYQMVGAALGGSTGGYALINVTISGAAVGIAIGGRPASRLATAGVTFLLGAVITVGLIGLSGSPTIVAELAPAVLAPLIVLGAIRFQRRRSGVRRPTPAPRQAAVKKPRSSYALVLVAGVCLGLFSHMAPAVITPASLPQTGAAWSPHPVIPAGWSQGRVQHYSWASRYFGQHAQLTRYWFKPVQQSGPTQRVVVDALNTPATGPLSVYPAIALYRLASPYIQSPTLISLGHHVEATMFYANPYTAVDPVQTEWVLLTWMQKIRVGGHTSFQRLTVITTDGVPTNVSIPEPASPWSNGTVRLVFKDVLRGLPSPSSTTPGAQAQERLTHFAHQVVATQSAGVSR